MSNRAYLSLWFKDFRETAMIEQFQKLLETVPLSASQPGFTSLVVRAIGPDESPVVERDLRGATCDAARMAELTAEYAHADCSYEVEAFWDLWTYDAGRDLWQQRPMKLEIQCLGELYDDGAFRELGHCWINAGFEHLFTGHAGLLGAAATEISSHEPAEAEFLDRMRRPGGLADYRQKTQENIRKLVGWATDIERAVGVERWRLWSEGEENFEARLDSILAER